MFVTADDRIKIADFGSATFAEVTGSQEATKSAATDAGAGGIEDPYQTDATDLDQVNPMLGIVRSRSLTTGGLEQDGDERANRPSGSGRSDLPGQLSSEAPEVIRRFGPRKGQSAAAAPGAPAPGAAGNGNMAAQAALGTPLFMAPELFKCSSSQNKINGPQFVQPSVDIWSLGATLFMMVCGKPPWVGRNELELSHRIQHLALEFPNHAVLSSHLRNVIRKMLVKEPMDRIEMHELFEDAWVTQEGCDPIELNVEDFAGLSSLDEGDEDEDEDSGSEEGGNFQWEDDGNSETGNSSDGIIDNDDSEEEGDDESLRRDLSRQSRSRSNSRQRDGSRDRGKSFNSPPQKQQLPAAARAAALVEAQEMLELTRLLKQQAALSPKDTARVRELMQSQARGSLAMQAKGQPPPSSPSADNDSGGKPSSSVVRERGSSSGESSRKRAGSNKGPNQGKSPEKVDDSRHPTRGTVAADLENIDLSQISSEFRDLALERLRVDARAGDHFCNSGDASQAADSSSAVNRRRGSLQVDKSAQYLEVSMLSSPTSHQLVTAAEAESAANRRSMAFSIADHSLQSNGSSSSIDNSSLTNSSQGGSFDSSFENKRELPKSTANFTFMAASIEVVEDHEDDEVDDGQFRDLDSVAKEGNSPGSSSSDVNNSGSGNSNRDLRFQTRGVLKLATRDGLSSLRVNGAQLGDPRGSSSRKVSESGQRSPDAFKDLLEGGSDSEDSDEDDEDYDVIGTGDSSSDAASHTDIDSSKHKIGDAMAFLDDVIKESGTRKASCVGGNNYGGTSDGIDLPEHVALLSTGPEQFQPLPPLDDPWLQDVDLGDEDPPNQNMSSLSDRSTIAARPSVSFSFAPEDDSPNGGDSSSSSSAFKSSLATRPRASSSPVEAAPIHSLRNSTSPGRKSPPRVASPSRRPSPPRRASPPRIPMPPPPPKRHHSPSTTTRDRPAAPKSYSPPPPESDQAPPSDSLALASAAKATTVAGCTYYPMAVSPVQVRNWGAQSNLATTFVRFGLQAGQGPCKYMEDRIVCLPTLLLPPSALPPQPKKSGAPALSTLSASAAAVDSIDGDVGMTANKISAMPSPMAVNTSTLAGSLLLSGSFFAVYDGHGGSESADYLKEHLHAAIARRLADAHKSTVAAAVAATARERACLNRESVRLSVSGTEEKPVSAPQEATRLGARRSGAVSALTSKFRGPVPRARNGSIVSSTSTSTSTSSTGRAGTSSSASTSTGSASTTSSSVSSHRGSLSPPSRSARRSVSPTSPRRPAKAQSLVSAAAATKEVTSAPAGSNSANHAVPSVSPEAWLPVEQAISQAFLEVDAAVVLAERQRLASAKRQLQGNGLSHPSRSTGSTALTLLLFRAPAAAPASPFADSDIATAAAPAAPAAVDVPVAAALPAAAADVPEETLMTNPMLKQVAKSPGSASPQTPRPAIRSANRGSISPVYRSRQLVDYNESNGGRPRSKSPPVRRRNNSSVASAQEAGYSGHSSSSGGSGGGSSTSSSSSSDNSGGALWLVAANVGDCRAVLSRGGNAVPLTFDHKVPIFLIRLHDIVLSTVGLQKIEAPGTLNFSFPRMKCLLMRDLPCFLVTTSRSLIAFNTLALRPRARVNERALTSSACLGRFATAGSSEFSQ